MEDEIARQGQGPGPPANHFNINTAGSYYQYPLSDWALPNSHPAMDTRDRVHQAYTADATNPFSRPGYPNATAEIHQSSARESKTRESQNIPETTSTSLPSQAECRYEKNAKTVKQEGSYSSNEVPRDENGSGPPAFESRTDSQERNRLAANRYRIRQQAGNDRLLAKVQEMEQQHSVLSNQATELTAELYHLKRQLLTHGDCDCLSIQTYFHDQLPRCVYGQFR